MSVVVEAKHLSKTFGALQAVSDVTFQVFEGEIFGVVGPDGAGKTTSLRLLTSIMDPTSGDAWIGGYHTVREAELIKPIIGYMSQRFGLYHDLTVLENLQFFADLYEVPSPLKEERIESLLNFSHLAPFKDRRAGQLSGGMKQKLGLSCALLHRPKILFLDEPTNGVDPVSRREFWKILYTLLDEGVTIVLSTAYMDEAERCTRLGFIHEGSLLAVGKPSEIKQLIKGGILEIRTEDPRKALGIFRAAFQTHPVRLMGSRIHIAAENPESTRDQIQNFLETIGMRDCRISLVEPTLEDVFISNLTKGKET